MAQILDAKEERARRLAGEAEAVALLEMGKEDLLTTARTLEEELKVLKEQEKVERELARAELAQV